MRKIKLTIPEDINDITLGRYMKFNKLKKGVEDDLELSLIALSCYLNITVEQVKMLPKDKVVELSNIITNISENRPKTFINRFKIRGQEFGFIPNLDDISYGEYIDLDTYSREPENFNKFMAVCFRPIKESFNNFYNIEEYEGSNKYSEVLLEMPLGVALNCQGFFLTLGHELLSNIEDCSQEVKQIFTQLNMFSDKNMGITKVCMP